MPDVTTAYTQKFEEFFSTVYKNELDKIAEHFPEKKTLEIEYGKLEQFDTDLADELITKPYSIIEAAESAIKSLNLVNASETPVEPHVRFVRLPA
ncbi:MAG: hypothetical protein V1911_03555, partial [Candidatus Micrarchaeota archaeon]